jgi:hypothetical protein
MNAPRFTPFVAARGRLALIAGAATSASAELDQSNPFQSGFTQLDERPVAQRFGVGRSGQLESVEISASPLSPTGNLLVGVYPVLGGALALPGAAVPIATGGSPVARLPGSSAGGAGPDFVWIDLDLPVAGAASPGSETPARTILVAARGRRSPELRLRTSDARSSHR